MLLNSGCTLDMLGYYDNASDGQAKSEKTKAFTSTCRKETAVEEDIVVEDETLEDEQEAITPQEVIKKELPKSPPVKEKEQEKKVVDDEKKKTPEEIKKMKQEAKERVINRQDKQDEELSSENKGLFSCIAWKGYDGEKTLKTEHVNAKTGVIYPDDPSTKYEEDASIIIRVYYNGQYVEGEPMVYANLKSNYDVTYTITKDCSWVKDDNGTWMLDVCKVDYKNNKFEPLLYNKTQ